MTDERPEWARRLEDERVRRDWNKHEMARRLRQVAGTEYPPVKSLVRQIWSWEKGQHFPRDWIAHYAAAFEMPETELFPAAPEQTAVPVTPSVDLDSTSGDVLRALDVVSAGNPAVIADGLGELIDHYAQTIAALPPTETYSELVAVRAYASTVLGRY